MSNIAPDEKELLNAIEELEQTIIDFAEDHKDLFLGMDIGEKFIEIPISHGVSWRLKMEVIG